MDDVSILDAATLHQATDRNWFRTWSGRRFNLADPLPDQVDLDDIAHALAHSSRYNGHLPKFYSIAQHCIHVMQAVVDDRRHWALQAQAKADLKLLALCHDAGEAYTGDIIRPLKKMLPGFREIEVRIDTAIAITLRLESNWTAAIVRVHDADNRVFAGECVTLRGWTETDFANLGDPTLFDRRFQGVDPDCWSPDKAKAEFLKAFETLQQEVARRAG